MAIFHPEQGWRKGGPMPTSWGAAQRRDHAHCFHIVPPSPKEEIPFYLSSLACFQVTKTRLTALRKDSLYCSPSQDDPAFVSPGFAFLLQDATTCSVGTDPPRKVPIFYVLSARRAHHSRPQKVHHWFAESSNSNIKKVINRSENRSCNHPLALCVSQPKPSHHRFTSTQV